MTMGLVLSLGSLAPWTAHADLAAEATGLIDSRLAAGRIDGTTDESVRIRGSDAIAGLGDWYLSNGILCAAVLGVESEGQLIQTGGTLIDLGFCGRDDDQFIGLEPLFNLSRSERLAVTEITAEVDGAAARIRASAEEDGLHYTTTFTLDLDDPTRILIHTTLERVGPGERLYAMAELLQNTESSLRNFVVNRSGANEGFDHISLEESRYLDIARSIQAISTIVILGSEDQGPAIAYGYRPGLLEWHGAKGQVGTLTPYGLAMESVSAINVLVKPLWFESDGMGLPQAFQGFFMDLDPGESLVFERTIRVSQRADVASFTDRIFSEPGEAAARSVRGRVDAPSARLHFATGPKEDPPNSPITMARPDSGGSFELVLPPGEYTLRALAPAGRTIEKTIRVPSAPEGATSAPLDLGLLTLSPAARVRLPRGGAMRLVFRGRDGTPDPVFGSDLSGLRINGVAIPTSLETTDVHLAGVESDPEFVEVPPGRYRVHATHGPEFSVTRFDIEAIADETVDLDIAHPVRELETPGWIAADFHVHAAPSFDSTLPLRPRIASFAAEGAEILVATDHDVVSDYSSTIAEMGLRHVLHSLSGAEVTSVSHAAATPYTSGHINVFPLPYRPELNRGGAIRSEGKRLREIIAQAREIPGDRIVQLNHPRRPDLELNDGSFFDHLAVPGKPFDPKLPMESEPNRILLEKDPVTGLRDIDFDAIELLNSNRMPQFRAVKQDWLSLLRQGYRVTANANSDTHEFGEIASVPRNYVRMEDDSIDAFSREPFIAAALRGESFGTTGPILEVSLEGLGPGSQFSGDRGVLRVELRAASWVPLGDLRIIANGELSRELLDAERGVHEFEMIFEVDAFVVVEIEGVAEGVYAEVLPGFVPLAFSNPIYVDANRDGVWTPPGLRPTSD